MKKSNPTKEENEIIDLELRPPAQVAISASDTSIVYTKSKFDVVSKVQQHLTEVTHDQGRNIAGNRVIPCFQI